MWITSKFLAVGSICILFSCIVHAVVVKKENSLNGPYEGRAENLQYWDLTGNAQLGEKYIRLTTDEPNKHGAIWNNFPVLSKDWEFQVQFQIHGKGVHLNGDGLAIWYVRDALHSGPIFGSKDYFSGLGLFVDTFDNAATPHQHRHPYISAVVNDGSFPYDHDEHGTQGQIGACHIPVRNLEHTVKVAVSYMNDALTVFFDAEGLGQWKPCFRAVGVHLPSGYHFGISASTGQYSDNHDVISVTSLNLDSPDKPYVDRSNVIPLAEFIEVPIKPLKEVVEEGPETKEPSGTEEIIDDGGQSTSLLKKAIYIGGIAVILIVIISLYKKYSAQRKERMQKRLF
ncbi:VIP36-like protein [Uloborus diversus]|uniref:VIP36-like protein n=1 Tax=Uloborus diversus TaxID=327109 RepID=UPI00240A2280|nr:VIP36-like protein [Uloborus diversus]